MNRRVGNHSSQEIFKRIKVMMCFLINEQTAFYETCHHLNNISGSVHGSNFNFSGNILQNYTQKTLCPCFLKKQKNIYCHFVCLFFFPKIKMAVIMENLGIAKKKVIQVLSV